MDTIKESHRRKSDSASENPVVTKFKQDLEEAANFKGSKLEQLLILFCKQTKLPYNKLTEEEKQWLVRIAHKSELVKGSVLPRRRKRR